MRVHGTPSYLLKEILTIKSGRALANSAPIRGQLLGYQAASLFELAKKYNGQPILEIGTLAGYSTSIIAQACPNSTIITLNNAAHEIKAAKRNLVNYTNVKVLCKVSWDYLLEYTGPEFGMVFVDGDHVRVGKDLSWWNKLAVGGLMLFHDYSVNEMYIHLAIETMSAKFNREPCVSIVDTDEIGMAGFYKCEGDIWQI